MNRWIKWVALAVVMVPGAASAASAAEAALQRFVDGVQTLSAHFEQSQLDEKGAVIDTRSGEFLLARPGRFRWSYTQPYEQLMVCDGTEIWNYEPDLAQATVRDAAELLRGSPAALLAQRSQLGEGFSIEDGGRDGKASIVRLKPKSEDSDFKAIDLWLDNGVPQRMRFLDQLGGTTDIRFSQIRTKVTIDPSNFRFQPAKGVEVIDARASAP